MVKVYIDQQVRAKDELRKKAVQEQLANQASVLVAKQDIAQGTAINPEMFDTAIVPNQYVEPRAVTSLDRIAGMVAVSQISKGEQITLNKLAFPKQAGAGGLAQATPVGKRAVTISVDNMGSLSGMVNAGDYVDISARLDIPVQTSSGQQASQPAVMPLFQNVLVLAVGRNVGGPAGKSSGESRYRKEEASPADASGLITIALSPQEANLIAFVQEQGRIRLTLRAPSDSQIEPIQPASWDTLFQYIMPKEPAAPQPEVKETPRPVHRVEIYRGMSKETVTLSE
jgi:pilus assembly protein CpaB